MPQAKAETYPKIESDHNLSVRAVAGRPLANATDEDHAGSANYNQKAINDSMAVSSTYAKIFSWRKELPIYLAGFLLGGFAPFGPIGQGGPFYSSFLQTNVSLWRTLKRQFEAKANIGFSFEDIGIVAFLFALFCLLHVGILIKKFGLRPISITASCLTIFCVLSLQQLQPISFEILETSGLKLSVEGWIFGALVSLFVLASLTILICLLTTVARVLGGFSMYYMRLTLAMTAGIYCTPHIWKFVRNSSGGAYGPTEIAVVGSIFLIISAYFIKVPNANDENAASSTIFWIRLFSVLPKIREHFTAIKFVRTRFIWLAVVTYALILFCVYVNATSYVLLVSEALFKSDAITLFDYVIPSGMWAPLIVLSIWQRQLSIKTLFCLLTVLAGILLFTPPTAPKNASILMAVSALLTAASTVIVPLMWSLIARSSRHLEAEVKFGLVFFVGNICCVCLFLLSVPVLQVFSLLPAPPELGFYVVPSIAGIVILFALFRDQKPASSSNG